MKAGHRDAVSWLHFGPYFEVPIWDSCPCYFEVQATASYKWSHRYGSATLAVLTGPFLTVPGSPGSGPKTHRCVTILQTMVSGTPLVLGFCTRVRIPMFTRPLGP